MTEELSALFARVGLTDAKAKEAANNKKLAAKFERAIKEVGPSVDKARRLLL
jgi:hypothetical protein